MGDGMRERGYGREKVELSIVRIWTFAVVMLYWSFEDVLGHCEGSKANKAAQVCEGKHFGMVMALMLVNARAIESVKLLISADDEDKMFQKGRRLKYKYMDCEQTTKSRTRETTPITLLINKKSKST